MGVIEENNAFILGFASKGVILVNSGENADLKDDTIIEMEYEITEDAQQVSTPFGSGYLLLWDDKSKYGIQCDTMTIDWGDGTEENKFNDVYIGNNTTDYISTKIYHIYKNIGRYNLKLRKIKGIKKFSINRVDYLKSFVADFSKCDECFSVPNNFSLSNNIYLENIDVNYISEIEMHGFCSGCGSSVEGGMDFKLNVPNVNSLYSCVNGCKVKSVYINAPKITTSNLISVTSDNNTFNAEIISGALNGNRLSLISGNIQHYLDVTIINGTLVQLPNSISFLGLKLCIPKVTSLQQFAYDITFDENLEYIEICETNNLTNIKYMFSYAKIYNAEIHIENGSNILNGDYAFNGTTIKSLPFTDFSSLENANGMFKDCTSLTLPENNIIDFPNFKTGQYMFSNCVNLTGNYIFKLGSVNLTSSIESFLTNVIFNTVYIYLPGFVDIRYLAICNFFNPNSVSKSLTLDFEKTGYAKSCIQINLCHYIENVNILNIDTFSGIFNLANSYIVQYTKKVNISGLKNSKITSFCLDDQHTIQSNNAYGMEEFSFDGFPETCISITNCFNEFHTLKRIVCNGEVNKIDLCNLTNIDQAFWMCDSLSSLTFNNGSKVENMNNAFAHCESLTSISRLNIQGVKQINGTFTRCTSLSSITFSGNTTSYVLSIDLSDCALSHSALISMFESLPVSYVDGEGNGGTILIAPDESDTRENKNDVGSLTKEEIAIATNKGWNVDVTGNDSEEEP